jgi:curved DNA-binding protein CbpA
MADDLYALVGVATSASDADIQDALRAQQRKWSRRASNAPELADRQEAEKMVARLSEAKKILLDPVARAQYDRAKGGGSGGTRPPEPPRYQEQYRPPEQQQYRPPDDAPYRPPERPETKGQWTPPQQPSTTKRGGPPIVRLWRWYWRMQRGYLKVVLGVLAVLIFFTLINALVGHKQTDTNTSTVNEIRTARPPAALVVGVVR